MGCRSEDVVVATGWDRLHGSSGMFRVVRCGDCDLMRTDPRPTLEGMSAYYPADYAPHAERKPEGTSASSRSSASPPRNHGSRTATPPAWGVGAPNQPRLSVRGGKHELVPGARSGTLLELGCATGEFLARMRALGWSVHGIEPSAAAAALAQEAGFDVFAGPVERCEGFDTRFDLVVASHTLEHLHRPLECLERLRGWAAPGGYLTCAVPDASGFPFQRFGSAWYDLDLPRHLYHFTPATLEALLARAGWRVERVRWQKTLNGIVGSVGYWLRDRRAGNGKLADACLRYPRSRPWLRKTFSPLASGLAAVHATGRMVVWARAA